ncbi:MAG TPA: lysophospholipid acyltransferase family protein [Spongiibacteraceae bacterium]|nr:lysophospholipid acyltransferase family protein [Spongiibacteraceae bacterium]
MRTIYRLLGRLPLPLLYVIASFMALAVYHIARYRRQVVADNLAAAFPELDRSALIALEKRFYRHICDLGVEMLAARTLPREEFSHRVELANPEVLIPFAERRQSVLFLTCHQGNWEWLLHSVSNHMGAPIDVIYKTLHDGAFDDFMFECRARSGKPIAFQDAGREILRRRREFRGFAMLADQAPFKRDKRYWHDFFGRPASFYFGPQKIVEATQYPTVYVAMTKLRRGHYRAHFEVLAQPPIAKGGFAVLDSYIAALERSIRAQPETWFWSNRKWKHVPPTADEVIEEIADATDE